MKNYKVQAISNFKDKTIHQARRIGDIFICNEERYNELKFKNVIELVEIIKEIDKIDTMDEVVEKSVEEIIEKKPRKRKATKKEN